jgi:2-hydroxychromene-2-carboxylate isomerase
MPAKFPIATQNASRVFWFLNDSDPARAVAWARLCLRAYFTRGVDLGDAGALAGLASDLGFEPGAAERVWTDPVWKDRLRQVNDAAIVAGVFGAPFFVLDGEPFWGNDRRPQIERWLAQGPF